MIIMTMRMAHGAPPYYAMGLILSLSNKNCTEGTVSLWAFFYAAQLAEHLVDTQNSLPFNMISDMNAMNRFLQFFRHRD